MPSVDYNEIGHVLGLRVSEESPYGFVDVARRGLPRQAVDALATALNSSSLDVSKYLPVSQRTLQRYEATQLLSPAVSDHLVQMARVVARANGVFGDSSAAAEWLKEPSVALGGTAPIEYLDTYSGIELVLGELSRIEHGIFS